jgi:hypothetical protein
MTVNLTDPTKRFFLENADHLIAICVETGVTDEEFADFILWLDASEPHDRNHR